MIMEDMKPFKDHFSTDPAGYDRHRPRYPDALFRYLAGMVPGNDLAWDCATGTGQAARTLAGHFHQVLATDASIDQLRRAGQAANIHYICSRAESCPVSNQSVDLLCVAQALHWFDIDAFMTEVQRVLRPDGVLAVWTYSLLQVTPEMDPIIEEFHNGFLADYWPTERRMVIEEYRFIDFPFHELEIPPFTMSAQWSLDELMGYFRTWSSVKAYQQQHSGDATDGIYHALAPLWGTAKRKITFPLITRVFRKV